MITRADIVERSTAWGLSEGVVEKDYVIGWLLWGIGSHPVLSKYWAFKGGTCLKKCFFETYRFSEDLDFSVLPGSPHQNAEQVFDHDAIRSVLEEVFGAVAAASGINLTARDLYLKVRNQGRALEGRVYYLGPTGTTQVAKVKLDISGTEAVVQPTVLMPIRHSFPDDLPDEATVRSYSFEEVFAEKIRAMGQRGRPRDLYDIVNLYRHQGLGRAPALIRQVLVEKCAAKDIDVPTYETLLQGDAREELEAEWSNMLAHQLPALPSVDFYIDELENLFLWLKEELEVEALPEAPVAGGPSDASWQPPQLISTWGGAPVETIRFAGANLLKVELDYFKADGERTTRVVEPYSLRRSREGAILLFARRPDESTVKAYRVDRIQSVRVNHEAFEPLYPVELTAGGAISTRPVKTGALQGAGTRFASLLSGAKYSVRCYVCGRTFHRKTRSTELRPHKDEYGSSCRGRRGFAV